MQFFTRCLLSGCLFFIGLKSNAQVIADPATDFMIISNLADSAIDENLLPFSSTYKLHVPVFNKDFLNGLPPGTCKIKIGLGSKLVLAPGYNINNAPANQYFDWTYTATGGQVQITGELKHPLPANFANDIFFDVTGNVLGTSTITTNFLITNHNSSIILSDGDPTNNTSFLSYTIVGGVVPVTFTSVNAIKNLCALKILFTTETEVNVKRYDIEVSKDGIAFNKIGELPANQSIKYHYDYSLTNNNQAALIYFRVKSVDKDGFFQYSPTKTVDGLCGGALSLTLYPNPVKQGTFGTIKATNKLLDGKYRIELLTVAGESIFKKEFKFDNDLQFNLPIGNIAAGKYILSVTSIDSYERFALPMLVVK